MKGRNLFFAAALVHIAFHSAMGATDARNLRRVGATTGVSATTSRQKNSVSTIQSATRNTATKSVSTAGRATTVRPGAVISDAARGATTTSARTTKNTTIQPRTVTGSRDITSRTTPAARNASAPQTTTVRTRAASISRAATAADADAREQIITRDFNSCRQVYYECMDEFCANKDTQLKRCACSTRIHEFDKTKQQLSNVEDKLLDFNQRLLTVSMDKEDAEALFTATEGEIAFNQKDTSASKKILDEITKKLNTDTNSGFGQGLSPISLSLNEDSAFDNVDSLMGASTATKEGVALYNAALPICREMAAEVCTEQDLAIAESGYQMTIEQDCNIVAKAYESQTTQAREKIREGAALLDISRLDTYQNRNADNTLTCKNKMLEQLYNTSVCGAGLSKCLDISGQYIDPSTGQAFLTENLVNLSTLITRPDDGGKWTTAGTNERFVSYLLSKKKYLEPASENCQDIADMVWNEFIEDALTQIKLAQDKKLEEVRQSCTTLTTQCLSNAAESLADFDSRALSTFGVLADKTVNGMCASIQNACSALIDSAPDTNWIGGMTQIATAKTYDTILQTCREVGRACIIQQCTSISGNFAMCESIENSVNRRAILDRTSCWTEVKACVAQAGADIIDSIYEQKNTIINSATGDFYKDTYYNVNYTKIDDICEDDCKNVDTAQCRVCRISEKIWGNCGTITIGEADVSNKIIMPTDDTATLLSWFAKNTGTAEKKDNCATEQ
ncbi:hypothetical protein HDR61_03765 [bacterium]|nr:hypothetical protein [bacterium]